MSNEISLSKDADKLIWLLQCLYGDDVCCESMLEDVGITYMEGRFQRKIAKVVDYLGKLLP